jgi:3-hydroxyisobutyrate dehydrogenase
MGEARWPVGFIGLGVMGRSMAGHLLAAGHPLAVYTRTRTTAQDLETRGAAWAHSPKEVARGARVVITMVGYPSDVEDIYLGPDGLVAAAESGTYLIDMTTSSPLLAARIHEAAAARGVHALDAPVSGGDVGAREARLTIMAGGEEEAFAAVRPVLEVMGKNIVLQGAAGAGQHTKMCNQIAIASGMIGACEAIAYARRAGLDASRVLESIGAGAAGSWTLSNLAPRMIAGNFAPGFYVKHFIKDMRIARDVAIELGMRAPGLELALSLYEELAARGDADSGTQALYKLFDGSHTAADANASGVSA